MRMGSRKRPHAETIDGLLFEKSDQPGDFFFPLQKRAIIIIGHCHCRSQRFIITNMSLIWHPKSDLQHNLHKMTRGNAHLFNIDSGHSLSAHGSRGHHFTVFMWYSVQEFYFGVCVSYIYPLFWGRLFKGPVNVEDDVQQKYTFHWINQQVSKFGSKALGNKTK